MKKELSGKIRKEKGKNSAGRLRQNGFIPANFISAGRALSFSVLASDFNKLLQDELRQSSIIDLIITDGEEQKIAQQVFVKELQRDPITGNTLHIDFYGVTPGSKVQVSVAIETEGIARGIKAGGAMEHYIRSLKIRTVPESFKDVIKIDITELDVGSTIYLNDIDIPKEWELLMEGNPLILRIGRARVIQEEEEEEATALKTEAGAETEEENATATATDKSN